VLQSNWMERTSVDKQSELSPTTTCVCLARLSLLPLLFFSVAPIITAGMNVVMNVIVITVIGTVRSALPTVVNARVPRHPVVTLMTADRGLLRAGSSRTAGRLVTRKGRTAVPRSPILAKPATTAVGTKGSGMKRMTDMKTALPGTRTAMRASGKTNREGVT